MKTEDWKEKEKLLGTNEKLLSTGEKIQNAREKLGNEKIKNVLLWIFEIAATLVLAAVVAIVMFQSVTMQESSMEPTLSVGDKYFMNRIIYKVSSPERGDIVVFKTNDNEDAALHIRRVIGLPGDTVQIANGRILINGETYKEGKDFPMISDGGAASNPVNLETGEYFVLGDNRNNSEDSRHGDIGIVKKRHIAGKLWFTLSPAKKTGFLKG